MSEPNAPACAWPKCGSYVSPGDLFCREHWFRLPRGHRVLSAALSAHGSAAVFVDGAATFGVAESGNRYCWGWSSPLSSDWRGKETGRGSGLEPPATCPPRSGWPGPAAVPRSRGKWHAHAESHQRPAAHGVREPPRPPQRRSRVTSQRRMPRGADRGHRGVRWTHARQVRRLPSTPGSQRAEADRQRHADQGEPGPPRTDRASGHGRHQRGTAPGHGQSRGGRQSCAYHVCRVQPPGHHEVRQDRVPGPAPRAAHPVHHQLMHHPGLADLAPVAAVEPHRRLARRAVRPRRLDLPADRRVTRESHRTRPRCRHSRCLPPPQCPLQQPIRKQHQH